MSAMWSSSMSFISPRLIYFFAAYLTDDEPFIWSHPLRRPTSLVELVCILGRLVGAGERWVGMCNYKGLGILIPEKDIERPFPCSSVLKII